ncbi:peptidoglycan-binding protein [Mangrovicoccus sp. HB161399]|uniref:peptidoglycan-binding domain-containing protein n=1 Tax=Mangrovicoccus sp. HB161399 TaxID=2720392 RepID=UPI0015540E5B|nr:M15 family peptidase [Mangrovicoccus sp. HB161399]
MIPIPRDVIAWAQRQLRAGDPDLADDGLIGPDTHGALMGWAYGREADLPDFWPDLPAERLMAAFLQIEARAAGRDPGPVDGWWGPRTAAAVEVMTGAADPLWRDRLDAARPAFPVETRGQQELVAFYGLPGREGGYRPPLVQVPVPWVMRLAWNTSATRSFLWIHEKAAPSAARALGRIASSYTEAEIRDLGIDLFGGDYAPRKMRGADRHSLHSWGISIDFDPVRNALRYDKRTARLAQRDAVPFWSAWESEGWCSLGRARDYDWMHVQAATRGY